MFNLKFPRWDGQLAPEDEKQYRLYFMAEDVQQSSLSMLFLFFLSLIFILNDYFLFGISLKFLVIGALRVLFLLYAGILYFRLKHFRDPRRLDFQIFILAMITSLAMAYVNFTRGGNVIGQAVVTVVIILIVYLGFPIRLLFRFIPALIITAGSLGGLIFTAESVSRPYLLASIVSLFLANMFGLFVSHKLYSMRRQQFMANVKNVREISDRKRAEEALRDSEEFRKTILENSSYPLVVRNPQEKVIYVNPAFEQLTGFASADIIGTAFPAPWWPGKEIGGIYKEHPVDSTYTWDKTEAPLKKKSGELVWTEVTSGPILNDGQLQYWISNWVDIHDRKKAEEILKYQALLIQSVSDAVVANDLNFVVISWNRAAEAIYGWRPEEAIGQRVSELIPMQFPGTSIDAVRSELIKEGKWNGDVIQRRKDGKEISILASLSVLRDDLGNQIGIIGVNRDITERKNAEEAILRSEQRFRQMFEKQRAVMLLIEPVSGGIVDANEAASNYYGYSREALKNLHISDINQLPMGQQNQFIFHHRLASGEIRIVEVQSSPVDVNGQALLFSIIQDVTERRKAEEALTESRNKYQALIETTSDFIWEIDDRGKYTYCSPQAKRLWGMEAAEMVGKSPFDMMPPEVRTEAQRTFGSFVQQASPISGLEIASYDSQGRVIMLEISGVPFFDGQGKLQGYRGISRDVTGRQRAEEILRKNEERIRLAAEIAEFGTYDYNFLTDEAYWSPGLKRLYGLKVDEPVLFDQNAMAPGFHPDDYQAFLAAMIAASDHNGNGELEMEFRVIQPQGVVRWLQVRGQTEFTGEGQNRRAWRAVGATVDITERKLAEEKLKSLYENEKTLRLELEKEAKVRAMFIDILAHELRTPLTPLLASSGMLMELVQDRPDEITQRLAANIYSSSISMVKRLEELLDMSRFARGTFKLNLSPTNIPSLVNNVISRFKPSLDQSMQNLVVQMEADLPELGIDPSRFEQVIVNLLSNAGKFSPPGSDITISVLRNGDNLRIAVKDNGIGISIDDQKTLFEPYHRVQQDRSKYPGTGLGLAICKQIVEAHGGKIWVECEGGSGCAFIFEVPIREKDLLQTASG